MVREVASEGANEALVQQTHATDCCGCPAVDSDYVLTHSGVFREALEQEVPRKWFLVEGTLIAALRYGAHAQHLTSGKLNFVDSDFDSVVICRPEQRADIVRRLMNHLPGWECHTGSHVVKLQATKPKLATTSRSAGGQTLRDLRAHLHFLDEGSDGNFSVPWGQESSWRHWLSSEVLSESLAEDEISSCPSGQISSEALAVAATRRFRSYRARELPHDLVFPLQKVQWGGGDAYAPNKYLEILRGWNDGEYSKAPLWKPRESYLATAGLFQCPCSLDEDDYSEICEGFSRLQASGFAAFDCSA